jgi:poly(hydroxyalkanoate) depolymerase family esterase
LRIELPDHQETELSIIEALRRRLRGVAGRPPAASTSATLHSFRTRTNPAAAIEDALARAGLMGPGTSSRLLDRSPHEGVPFEAPSHDDALDAPGAFLTKTFANAAGMRTWKLYVPSSYATGAHDVPLLVMLHGCTQSADDFAAGTRMNQLAEQHGFLVAYPEQPPRANGARCWNWFVPTDQARDRGEPSLIAGITREIAQSYRVDERRIFVAGLSAGAAMAIIMGAAYPELYVGVGAHSGLPLHAAHDVPSAFQVMKDASARGSHPPLFEETPARSRQRTIILHGDRDSTVATANSSAIAADAARIAALETPIQSSSASGRTVSGAEYTRTSYVDANGKSMIELWILHGAGHAWAGGRAKGSFTEPAGVDASTEMVRFFGLAIP